MDGGRRLLRPLKEVLESFHPSFPVFAGASIDVLVEMRRPVTRSGHRGRTSFLFSLLSLATAPGANAVFSFVFLAVVGFYGSILGGQYAAFTASHGTLADFVARSIGFGIRSVTVTGVHELAEKEILAAAGISPTKSLLFLNAAKLREKLKALPLVKEASVSKLYPHRLLIEIEERKPIALWQKDGRVQIIAGDGIPIDTLHDARFLSLPLAVGDGANAHIGDYLALLHAAGGLRGRIEAGIFVAQRRWNLKLKNGIEVALPEKGAVAAVAELDRLQRDYHVLDKDIVALDLRIPGRLIVTLPEDIARARMEVLAHRTKRKGGQT